MPLVGTEATLSALILTTLNTLDVTDNFDPANPKLKLFCDAIAKAVLDHIIANSAASVISTTSCPAGSGTATGAIT